MNIINGIIFLPLYLKKILRGKYLNNRWKNFDYIYNNLPCKNIEFYRNNIDIAEIEHQVGRYLNMQSIVNEIIEDKLEGSVVEFGTFQGLGLILLDRLLASHSKTIIGIDSFEGLPESSTIWKKGLFSNTSLELVKKNIKKYSSNPSNFVLIKGWFNDKYVSDTLYSSTQNVILVHFDSDLGSSTYSAIKMVEPYLLNRNKPIYFLFDDWGCSPDEIPDVFNNWLKNAEDIYNFKAKKLYSTKLTRYYKLTFS
jgi:hypothetical protein